MRTRGLELTKTGGSKIDIVRTWWSVFNRRDFAAPCVASPIGAQLYSIQTEVLSVNDKKLILMKPRIVMKPHMGTDRCL
jgi:hypothetical protein